MTAEERQALKLAIDAQVRARVVSREWQIAMAEGVCLRCGAENPRADRPNPSHRSPFCRPTCRQKWWEQTTETGRAYLRARRARQYRARRSRLVAEQAAA